MSQLPPHLSTRHDDTPAVVTEATPCRKCAYDLRGLRYGARCPECGTIITRAPKHATSMLGEAPRGYLRRLMIGFTLMGIGGAGYWLLLVAWIVLAFPPVLFTGVFLTRFAWIAGVIVISLPRPEMKNRKPGVEQEEWTFLRRASVISQLCPLAADALILANGFGASDWFLLGAAPFMLAWAAGLVPLCLLMAQYAHWASDTGLANRLEGAGWLLGACGILTLTTLGLNLLGLSITTLLLAFIWIPLVTWLGAYIFMQFEALELLRMVQWAIANANSAAAREQRRIERALREAEQARVNAPAVQPPIAIDEELYQRILDANNTPTHHDTPTTNPRPGDRTQPIIRPATDDPYRLEDD